MIFQESSWGIYIFRSSKELNRGAYIKDNIVVYNDGGKETEIILWMKYCCRKHNAENYLAAISAVFQYVKAGYCKCIKNLAALSTA